MKLLLLVFVLKRLIPWLLLLEVLLNRFTEPVLLLLLLANMLFPVVLVLMLLKILFDWLLLVLKMFEDCDVLLVLLLLLFAANILIDVAGFVDGTVWLLLKIFPIVVGLLKILAVDVFMVFCVFWVAKILFELFVDLNIFPVLLFKILGWEIVGLLNIPELFKLLKMFCGLVTTVFVLLLKIFVLVELLFENIFVAVVCVEFGRIPFIVIG